MSDQIKALTRDELQKLTDYLRGPEAKPQDVIFEVILIAGLRTEEFVRLRHRNFNPASGELTIDDAAKGSGTAPFDLNVCGVADRLRAAYLRRDLLLFEDDLLIYLFTNRRQSAETAKRYLRRRWKVITKKLFGPRFSLGVHCLRHTFASLIVDQGSIELVQQMLRHKSLNSTLRYVSKPTREQFMLVQREAASRMYNKAYQSE